MGVVPGLPVQGDMFGDEGAGIVSRVGSNVRNLSAGDRVMTWTFGTLSTRLKTISGACVKIPDSLTFQDAATMACVYVTVLYSLLDIGRLEADQVRFSSPLFCPMILTSFESILIHSGSGGVGFAAITVAQMIGAEVRSAYQPQNLHY